MDKNRKIILIGGAPTTGKSTIAALVAKHFNLPWISTDQIRELMRLVAKREDYPKLFDPKDYTAERFLTEFSAEQIANMEMAQAEAVWPGIKNFIEDDYAWKQGCVIEGVSILPHLIAQDFANNKNIKPVFLIDEDADRIRQVVFTRGLWDDAHTYSDDVKEKEVEWTLLFSHKLKTEVEKYNYPWVEVNKSDNDLSAVLSAVEI
jgi:2-phosphoglycerate kinase